MSPWDTEPTVASGFTNVALRVRYPDGTIVPVGLPAGTTGRVYRQVLADVMGPTYVVEGVIVDGILTVVED